MVGAIVIGFVIISSRVVAATLQLWPRVPSCGFSQIVPKRSRDGFPRALGGAQDSRSLLCDSCRLRHCPGRGGRERGTGRGWRRGRRRWPTAVRIDGPADGLWIIPLGLGHRVLPHLTVLRGILAEVDSLGMDKDLTVLALAMSRPDLQLVLRNLAADVVIQFTVLHRGFPSAIPVVLGDGFGPCGWCQVGAIGAPPLHGIPLFGVGHPKAPFLQDAI
mmetsp:Transcript_47434/g.110846  ORF Transcript_47434/g.110846 Transcript_47434/m.110846 type:complete len:218 (+) Transcript_47434:398-1051(+)